MSVALEPTTPVPRGWMSRAATWALWAVLTVAVAIAVRGLPWARVAEEIGRAHAGWLLLAIACHLALLLLWAMEWTLLVPPPGSVPRRMMVEITAVISAVINTVPFAAGEVSAMALLVGRAGLTRAAALTMLAADQLLVGVAKLTVLGAAALLAPLPVWMRGGTLGLVTAVALLAAVVLAVAHGGRVAEGRASRWPRWTARPLALARDVDAHLVALHRARRVWPLVAVALAKKAVEVLAVLAVQRACGIDLPAASALLLVAALGITTVLSVTPGNLGVYEATVFVVYRFLGVPAEAALAAALLQHLCFLLPLVLPGWVILGVRGVRPGGAPPGRP